jgi:peptide/nickel transport system substrate-binding protein
MRLRAATLALFLLGALVGCGGGGGSGTQQRSQLPAAGGGGTLDYALPGLPRTLDPLAARDRIAQTVTRQVYEPLIAQITGPYGQPTSQPGLVVGVRPSANRSIWSLDLRPGVRFQDGTPFNAGAVLANSRRWQSDPRGRALLPHLFAVDAPTPDEVRFLLDRPVRDFPQRLASPRLGIVSPRAFEPQSGQRARYIPDVRNSGTGAFQAGPGGPARLELSRFAGWWGSPMGLGPALDGVTFVVARLPEQRYRMLSDGTVQIADPLDAAGLSAAEADPLVNTIGGPRSGIGLEGSVRGISSAGVVPALSAVWLTRLTG